MPDKKKTIVRVENESIARMLGIGVAEEEVAVPSQDLNDVMHRLLLVGLYASIFFMVTGVIIDLIRNQALPTTVLSIPEAVNRLLTLRASGFFSIGLLILIMTPVLRVIGSVAVFVWERDWRYAGITVLVLTVMTISVWFGAG